MVNNDDTPGKILRAATAVFARCGLGGARVQEIADLAGCNKALIFYYFSSKENLYREVLRKSFGTLIDRLRRQALSGESPRESLEHCIATYIDYLTANPAVPRLVILEVMSGMPYLGPLMNELISKQPENVPELLLDTIREGVKSGQFREIDPGQTIISLVAMIVFPFIAWPLIQNLRPEMKTDRHEFWKTRKEHVTDLFLNGLLTTKGEAPPRKDELPDILERRIQSD